MNETVTDNVKINDTKETKEKKIKTSFMLLEIIKNIFTYIFIALKFFTFDMWVNIYNFFNYEIKRDHSKVNTGTSMQEENLIYERTKIKKRKAKAPKLSKARIASLEKKKKALLIDLQKAGASRSKTPHVYYYTVKNQDGFIINDTMSGFSKLDVNAYLLNEGYEVYDIKTSSWIDFMYQQSGIIGKTMSTKDLIFWLTQLSTYLKAGLPLSKAIKVLNGQMKGSKARKSAFEAISYQLLLGDSFSNAMEKQGNMFPALLINMIKAAEASGTLIETLDDLANYYTEMDETRKQMISAMTYPTIITVFSTLVITFILVYIVPQFVTIYADMNVELSGITKFVVNLSVFLKENIISIIGIAFLVIMVIVLMYKYIKAFRTSIQMLLMHIPVVKNIIIYNEITIFAKTFASLLKNNVFITDSMNILSRITNNEIYRAILYKTINNIVKGDKISEAFKDHWAVPDVAYYMIVTGESTGDLASMMDKVSDYYRGLHKSIVNNLKTFIEPIMIVSLSVIVGLIIIAVIVPMFGIYNEIQ